jgi:hypothetical protein
VTIDVILLALGSVIRPTCLAAVYALLSADQPRRLMIAYVIAGLAFTISFSLLILLAFNGVSVSHGSDRAKGIAEIAGGVIVLGFAWFVQTRGIGNRHASDAPRPPNRWERELKGRLTIKTAALAGPLTHLPGLFCLVALNIIAAHHPNTTGAVLEVLVYNLIWFAVPIAALAVCVVQPSAARDIVAAINDWTRQHARGILVGVSLLVGVVLLVRGALTV